MSESGSSQAAARTGSREFRLGEELRGERSTLGKSLLDVQRDLRIKAAYIAAIEAGDPSVFPNPSFIAGYVRSYARYLRREPDEVYRRFCEETGFAGAGGAPRDAGAATPAAGADGGGPASAKAIRFTPVFPLAETRRRRLAEIPVSAIGSLLVLVVLISGLGYGGWAILQNIQRVQFAPVDEVPIAVAEVASLAPPEPSGEPVLPELATPVAATALADLYRQQELEVPILVPRDGPIAAIDPDKIGLLAPARPEGAAVASLGEGALASEIASDAAGPDPQPNEPQVTTVAARPQLTVIAERPAWIRVYFPNGTIIFERILESGEAYQVPETAEPPLVWAGNSGSVYVGVNEALHGPIGRGTRAARDVPLEAEAITGRYPVVDDVPSVIAETLGNLMLQADVLVQ